MMNQEPVCSRSHSSDTIDQPKAAVRFPETPHRQKKPLKNRGSVTLTMQPCSALTTRGIELQMTSASILRPGLPAAHLAPERKRHPMRILLPTAQLFAAQARQEPYPRVIIQRVNPWSEKEGNFKKRILLTISTISTISLEGYKAGRPPSSSGSGLRPKCARHLIGQVQSSSGGACRIVTRTLQLQQLQPARRNSGLRVCRPPELYCL